MANNKYQELLWQKYCQEFKHANFNVNNNNDNNNNNNNKNRHRALILETSLETVLESS